MTLMRATLRKLTMLLVSPISSGEKRQGKQKGRKSGAEIGKYLLHWLLGDGRPSIICVTVTVACNSKFAGV